MQKNESVAATSASPYGDEIPLGELSRIGRFEVTLESVGNPDFGQHPDMSLPGVPRGRCVVASLQEAAAKCRQYIEENDLGGGNWSGGDVYEDGALVARISYNGRVWRAGETDKVEASYVIGVKNDVAALWLLDAAGTAISGKYPVTTTNIDEATRYSRDDADQAIFELMHRWPNEIFRVEPIEARVLGIKEAALHKAAESFWCAISGDFPEMTSGDSQLSGEDMAALAIWRDGNPGDRPVQNGAAFDVEWAGGERIEEALQHGIAAAGAVLFDGEVPPPPKAVIEQLNGCVRHVLYFNEPEANTRCRP